MFKIVTLRERLYFLMKSNEEKEADITVISFYHVSREIWLGNSRKLLSVDQSKFFLPNLLV